jgi:23S rRNA (adenine2030-N6)-methyltransferase
VLRRAAAAGRRPDAPVRAAPGRLPSAAEDLRDAGSKAIVLEQDGFTGINAFLPPPPRRALVLIDPPYEVKTDYRTVVAIKESLRRFPTGTYMVWYPKLHSMQSRELPEKLKRLPDTSWLHVSLDVHKPSETASACMAAGSSSSTRPGLPATLKKVMPYLVEVLGRTRARRSSWNSRSPDAAAGPQKKKPR